MPDLVGTGASERPAQRRGYAIDAQANALGGLLDVLGLARVAVVASGVAGAVAVELAARQPERVAALVLVGAVVHEDAWPTPGVLPLLPVGPGEAIFTRAAGRGDRGRRRVAGLLGVGPGARSRPLRRAAAHSRRGQGDAARLPLGRHAGARPLARARRHLAAADAGALGRGRPAALAGLRAPGGRAFGAAWVPVAGRRPPDRAGPARSASPRRSPASWPTCAERRGSVARPETVGLQDQRGRTDEAGVLTEAGHAAPASRGCSAAGHGPRTRGAAGRRADRRRW